MTMMTISEIGEEIRRDLRTAAARGDIPDHEQGGLGRVRYQVRATATVKTGPAVSVKIAGYEWMVGPSADRCDVAAWYAEVGVRIIAAVDAVVRRDRCRPALGGATKFGPDVADYGATLPPPGRHLRAVD